MKTGRPTDYSEESLKIAKDYLERCIREKEVPVVASLAYELDVSRKTIYNWGDKNPPFLHILDRLQALQESMLIKGGLSNDMNSNIVKLMLGKHGYKDSSDITTDGEKIGPVLVKFLDGKNDRDTK